MQYLASKARVANRGVPPDSFLAELIAWGRSAPSSLFAPNDCPSDIYAHLRPLLGPWPCDDAIPYRRAAMLEAMRVHAGFESSWNWSEGVDTTNHASLAHLSGQETGVFQVSFDSTGLDRSLFDFAESNGVSTADRFIPRMKSDHPLALDYYARLVRVSVAWAGPILRHEIDPWISKDAVAEFRSLLA